MGTFSLANLEEFLRQNIQHELCILDTSQMLLNSVENFIRLTRSFKDPASHGTRLAT